MYTQLRAVYTSKTFQNKCFTLFNYWKSVTPRAPHLGSPRPSQRLDSTCCYLYRQLRNTRNTWHATTDMAWYAFFWNWPQQATRIWVCFSIIVCCIQICTKLSEPIGTDLRIIYIKFGGNIEKYEYCYKFEIKYCGTIVLTDPFNYRSFRLSFLLTKFPILISGPDI